MQPPAPRARSLRAPSQVAVSAIGAGAVFGAWELATRLDVIGRDTLPPFSTVVRVAVTDADSLLPQLLTTLEESALGFALSVVVGIALAIAIVTWRPVAKSIYPLLIGSQVVPKIAIAPLLLIWFGFGITSKVLIAFLLAVFPVVIGTTLGLRSVPIEKIYLARTMGAGWISLFARIRFPSSLPEVFAGLKLAAAFSITGAIVGEFVAPGAGLGRSIMVSASAGETNVLFASILYIAVAGLLAFVAIECLERVAIPWHVSQRIPPKNTERGER